MNVFTTYNIFTIIILHIFIAEGSQCNRVREVLIDNILFCIDSSAISLNDYQIESLVNTTAKISFLSSLFNEKDKLVTNTIKNTDQPVVLFENRYSETTLRNLYKFGINLIEFRKDSSPGHIFFEPCYGRPFTTAEDKEANATDNIPDNYRSISEQEAIIRAQKLLECIYGKKEADKFDSMNVSDFSNYDYVISYTVKIKNDIWDPRTAEVYINAQPGCFTSFTGEGLSQVDFSYTPKITKKQVLKMFQDELIKINRTVTITKVVLYKHEKAKNSLGYAWQIYADSFENRKSTLSIMFFVDSETGEIIDKNLD